MLGQAQVLPLGVARGHRLVWRIKPASRPGLPRVAGQAQEWIFEIAQGLITGQRLKLVFALEPGLQLGSAQGLRMGWGPNLAFVSGQGEGQPFESGLGLRESSGLVQGLWLELELTFGFEGSELQQALQG